VKKFLSLLVAFGLLVGMSGLVGCGGDKDKKPAPAADKDKKTEEKKTEDKK